MSDLHHCHPFEHDGVSRIGRLVHALRPETFQIDERSIQDLIVEAHRFAQTLRFYNEADEQPEGAYWEKLWEVEILTYLAVLSAKDTDEMLRKYQQQKEDFRLAGSIQPLSSPKQQEAENLYSSLLDFLRNLALSLEESYQKLVRIKHPLQSLLLNRIRKENRCDFEELEGALERLISFHKGADDDLQMEKYAGFFTTDKRWGISGKVAYDAIAAQPNFFLDDLEEIFNSFYNTWLILKREAQKGFDEELARMELPEDVEYRIVQPHVVLFLVFLKLFRYAQDSLNELGAKHLDYYYEEILGLKRKGAVPDETYLIFELAKDFSQHQIEKGTPFLAGKDQNGKPLLFEATEDWVVRSAKVADIKTTWIDLDCKSIHANPDVKKVYENGAEKPNETAKAWRSMGDNQHLPDGEIGFAIASPQLILREGVRTIDITLELCNQIDFPDALRASYFEVYLSSEEAWVRPVPDSPQASNLAQGIFAMSFTATTIRLQITLERDTPPVDKLGEVLAEEAGFYTDWPIIKLLINPSLKLPCSTDVAPGLTTAEVYEMLRTLVVKEITIKVSAKGIREKLIFQSDQGIFDGTQKVFPFGPVPEVDNRFYIGSTEVFQKALDNLTVNFEWIAAPEPIDEYYKEYTQVNPQKYPTPNPQVLIDFIDRADGQQILLTQILREGVLPGVNTPITLKVSDVNLNPIDPNGLSVILDPSGTATVLPLSTDSDDPDLKLVTLPADTDLNTAVNIEITKGSSVDYEPLPIALNTPGPVPFYLEVVLFPREVIFEDISNVAVIKCRVTDVFGEVLTGVLINGDTASLEQGYYKIAPANLPVSNLKFELNGYDALQMTGIPSGFSSFEAVLHRQTSITQSGDVFNGTLSGTAKDSTTLSAGIENVIVIAKVGGDITAITRTQSGGIFNFPDISGADNIEFYYAGNEDTPVLTVSSINNAQLDVILPPRAIEKQPPLGRIDINGTIGAVGGGSLNNVNLEIDGESSVVGANFIRNNLLPSTQLKFTGTGYQNVEFTVDRYTQFDILMLPDSGSSSDTGGSLSGSAKVELTFMNIDLSSSNYTITTSTSGSTVGAPSGNKIIINDFTDGDDITIDCEGFESLTLEDVDDLSTLGVQLIPKVFSSNIDNGNEYQVIGKVLNLDGSPFEDARVVVDNGNYHYEATTNNLGEFTINLPTRTPNYHIKAYYKDAAGRYMLTVPANNPSVQEKEVILLLGHIVKSHPPGGIVTGAIRSADGKRLKGVKVKSGTNITYSDDNGDYEIVHSNTIEFSHPSFEDQLLNDLSYNSRVNVILMPLKTSGYWLMEGNVYDIFLGALDQVKTSIKAGSEFYEMGLSSADGSYRVAIPGDASISKLCFEREAYITTEVTIPPTSAQGGTPALSLMDVRMRNDQVEYIPLIEDNKTMKETFNVKINALNLVRDIRTQEFDRYSPTLKRGFIRFTLEQDDFMHEAYPKMLTWYSLHAAGEIDLNIDGDDNIDTGETPPPIPNPPYAPATNNISIDYTSTQVITGLENDGIDHFYHLLPFNGHKEIEIEQFEGCFQLLYPYLPDDHNVQIVDQNGDVIYDPSPYAAGNLYIGIENLKPGGTLSLLFTMLAGSEKEPEALAPDIHWSYLAADNTWLPFPTGQVLKDSTNGLTRTGMIQFQIPFDAVSENTMLNAAYYWLRAAAVQAKDGDPVTRIQSLPSLSGITAQVIQAKFADNDNELSHLSQPLPAGTISKLVQGDIAVKKVEQPIESFGGRLPEQMGEAFIYRVSERLRHKDRSVSVWDYEHLLLEKFNQVALAKCIQHTRYKPADKASERAPGYVTVAVVPGLSVRKGEPWPEPRFTHGALDDMQEYLTAHSNLFVAHGEKAEARLQVVNPLYEKVDVLVKVAFSAKDVAYAKQQLKEALTHYISPWLADTSRPPVFGRILEKSAILQFIEEQAYVDYVDVGEEADGFIIRKAVTDLVGRPVVFDYDSSLTTEDGQGSIDVSVREVKSRFYEGKICPESERSILIAGDIVVGTLEDAIELPLMPVKLSTISRERDRGATVASLSHSTTSKKVTEQATTKASSAKLDITGKAKAKSSRSKSKASSTRQSASKEAKKPASSKKTTRTSKPKSSSKSKTSSTGKGSSTTSKKRTAKKKTSAKSASSRKTKASAPKKDTSKKKSSKKDDTKA